MQNAQNMNLAMHLQAWNSRFFHCIVPTNSPNTLDTYRTYILFSAWLRFYLKQENYKNPRNASLVAYAVDGPLSKENQAPHLKFERPNGKMSESQIFFDFGQELVRPAHLKAQWSDFLKDLTRIKTNENQWRF